MKKLDRLDDLVRSEQRAKEQAEASNDISARKAHLARAAEYAETIKALRH